MQQNYIFTLPADQLQLTGPGCVVVRIMIVILGGNTKLLTRMDKKTSLKVKVLLLFICSINVTKYETQKHFVLSK